MNKEIIDKIAERYGKMWDIKTNILKGSLWWKDAIEDALNLKDEDIIRIIEDCKIHTVGNLILIEKKEIIEKLGDVGKC